MSVAKSTYKEDMNARMANSCDEPQFETLEEEINTEEAILRDMSDNEESEYNFGLASYLAGTINIDVPKEVFVRIMLDRDVAIDALLGEIDKQTRELCKADLYVWACMGASKKNNVSDSDNGWSHSEGGYSLSDYDKKLLLSEANKIYEKYDEETVGRTKVRIRSLGIRRADMTFSGEYRPHIVK